MEAIKKRITVFGDSIGKGIITEDGKMLITEGLTDNFTPAEKYAEAEVIRK